MRDAVRKVLRLWRRQRPAPRTLARIGRRNKIDRSSAGRDHLGRYERGLVVPVGGLIVVWAKRRPVQTANTFAEFYPHARVVTAGYGSSAMLNLVYASRPGTRILISSESYIALNEYLLGAVRGDAMHYFWCPADVAQPASGFSMKAFFSDFEFDLARDEPALRELLSKV